jgi:hypothetical protein
MVLTDGRSDAFLAHMREQRSFQANEVAVIGGWWWRAPILEAARWRGW